MTATFLDEGLDTDLLGALDFEYEPPCESRLGCDRTAAWKTVMKCCGAVRLMCDVCQKNDERVLKDTQSLRKVYCYTCQHEFEPAEGLPFTVTKL